jgi:hypothetical protein
MPDYLSIARRALKRKPSVHPLDGLENILKRKAVELWSDAAGRLFIIADEDDAKCLGEQRGITYTAEEVERVLQIADPALVLEVHQWKRRFDGNLRDVRRAQG